MVFAAIAVVFALGVCCLPVAPNPAHHCPDSQPDSRTESCGNPVFTAESVTARDIRLAAGVFALSPQFAESFSEAPATAYAGISIPSFSPPLGEPLFLRSCALLI